ncbi:outer membrane beta-barrel protein [Phocaeicola sp.]
MEEKDKWINNLRNRMADYSEPAPADLWEQLEKDLDVPKVVPMWRRWQAAAAVALLVVVSSLTVWFWHSSSADYIGQQSMEMAMMPEAEQNTPEPAKPEQPLAQTAPVEAAGKVASAKKRVAAIISPADTEVEEAAPETVTDEQQMIEKNGKEEQPVAEKGAAGEKQKPVVRSASGKRNNYYAYATPHKKKDKNWSVGLAAGNIPFSASNGYGGYGRFSVPTRNKGDNYMASAPSLDYGTSSSILPVHPVGSKEYAYNQILLNNLSDGEVNSDIKHKMPVTFGVSLRFDLDKDWAIETGLTYTLLSSDLRSGGKDSYIDQEQRLHYVGIPLKLNRNIWNNDRFEVYASAGGTVEKCVSGKLQTTYVVGDANQTNESEDVKINPLQFSVSAAAGAQFKITDKLGIYAEPGVVYYFDDGSEVSTIRKEHPFNFNIQLGVRFTLPK